MGAVDLNTLGLLSQRPDKQILIQSSSSQSLTVGIPRQASNVGGMERSPGLGKD